MKRSPAAAFWLSLIPGAGHVYVGQPTKGLVLIVAVASAIYLASEGAGAFTGILIPFLWIYAMIDAHRSAVAINHLLDTGQKTLEPTESLAFTKWWGWTLIGIGVVFTLDNFGWLDIDWIFDLWPLAIIALGVYLLKQPALPRTVPSGQESPSTSNEARETESGDG